MTGPRESRKKSTPGSQNVEAKLRVPRCYVHFCMQLIKSACALFSWSDHCYIKDHRHFNFFRMGVIRYERADSIFTDALNRSFISKQKKEAVMSESKPVQEGWLSCRRKLKSGRYLRRCGAWEYNQATTNHRSKDSSHVYLPVKRFRVLGPCLAPRWSGRSDSDQDDDGAGRVLRSICMTAIALTSEELPILQIQAKDWAEVASVCKSVCVDCKCAERVISIAWLSNHTHLCVRIDSRDV